MFKSRFRKMYTINDLKQVPVVNLQDVEKYEHIVKDIIKYFKNNKSEIVSYLARTKADENNTKMLRFGNIIEDQDNGIMVEVYISE